MSAVELLGQFTRNPGQTAEMFYGDDVEGVVHVFATTTARDLIPGATFRNGEVCIITADDSKWKWNGSAWGAYTGFGTPGAIKADGSVAFTADQSMGSNKLTSLAAGTVGTDAVNKSQLDAVSAAASGKFGFQYTFSTSTVDADPGAGFVRFDSATPSAVTTIYLDLVDADGNNLIAWIASLDDALGTVKGFVYFRDIADDTKWGQYRLDSIASPGGYVKLNVTAITAAGLPSTTAGGLLISFDAWGNGAAAGNGLTGTATHSVLAENATIAVGAGGIKRAAITGDVTIADGSNASAIAANAVTTAKILDGNVTPAKFSAGTGGGQQPFWDGTAWRLIGLLTGTDLTDANQTLAIAGGAQYLLKAALTASREKRLSLTGADADLMLTIQSIATRAFTMVVKDDASGAVLHTFPASAQPYAVTFVVNKAGTAWERSGWAPLGPVV